MKSFRFKRSDWKDWELLRVFKWVYPDEFDLLKPLRFEDLPLHFLNLLKVNHRGRWLWLTTRKHGAGIDLKTVENKSGGNHHGNEYEN